MKFCFTDGWPSVAYSTVLKMVTGIEVCYGIPEQNAGMCIKVGIAATGDNTFVPLVPFTLHIIAMPF